MTESVYPLLLEPRIDPKIWGGRRLETVLGKHLPTPERFGESLESDDSSRIAKGPRRGATLRELIEGSPGQILGELGRNASEPFGDFPLLAKFIDASDVLSVQVHPNDEEAAPLNKRGKTEAWHVIDADPGATLITGVKPGVTVEDMKRAIRRVALGELLVEETVSAGDTLIVPAGTTHAIGAGVLLYEIQEASDVTFRMYDWGRLDDDGNPRDLHVEESLRVVKADLRARKTRPLDLAPHRTMLTACRYFALEKWRLAGDSLRITSDGRSFRLLSGIAGELSVRADGREVSIRVGQTALIPAAANVIEVTGDAMVLVSYVPDLERDVRRPLLEAGHSASEITALAGDLGDLRA